MAQKSAEDRSGKMVGPYRLDSILGQGGMGTVFRAHDTFTGRDVAIKFLHSRFAAEASLAQRFIREARAAVRLKHPNVVEVLHMNQDELGVIYMVLELLEGVSLFERLKRGKLTLDETLDALLPIMSALELAHKKGIVHRDVKPENVFLSETSAGVRVPKLLDFGIAKMADAVTGISTSEGTIIGSPAYMSPEQAMGSNRIGPPADVWAMAVVGYECLTGQSPFMADDAQKCLSRVLTADPAPLSEVRPELPAPLSELFARALSKEIDGRPSMQELRSALQVLRTRKSEYTLISGSSASSGVSATAEDFPKSPSELGLSLPDELVALGDTRTQPHEPSDSVHGTLEPASSEPAPRPPARLVWLGAALFGAAALAFFLARSHTPEALAPTRGTAEEALPPPAPVQLAPTPAAGPAPPAQSAASAAAAARAPDGPAVRGTHPAEEVTTARPAPASARLPPSPPAAAAPQAAAKSPGSAASAASDPHSADELRRQQREKRIEKIPTVSAF